MQNFLPILKRPGFYIILTTLIVIVISFLPYETIPSFISFFNRNPKAIFLSFLVLEIIGLIFGGIAVWTILRVRKRFPVVLSDKRLVTYSLILGAEIAELLSLFIVGSLSFISFLSL